MLGKATNPQEDPEFQTLEYAPRTLQNGMRCATEDHRPSVTLREFIPGAYLPMLHDRKHVP